MSPIELGGVVPALLTPFTPDLGIDFSTLESLTSRILDVEQVGALFCTGHAGEVAALDRDEMKRVVETVVATVAARVPVLAGVYTDNLREAVRQGVDARQAGASALTVFPPPSFADGGCDTPDMPLHWHRTIGEEVGLPLVLFQFDRMSNLAYNRETLELLVELPYVIGVKEGSGDILLYEQMLEICSQASIPVLNSNNSLLLSSLVTGGDGILSGSGSVVPEHLGALWSAIQNKDLGTAQSIHRMLKPLLSEFYRPPFIDMHNRMKVVLNLLGALPSPAVRPPLLPLKAAEVARLGEVLPAPSLFTTP